VSRAVARLVAVVLLATPAQALADLPEPFAAPSTSDDYRVAYSLEGGIWTEGQGTLQHRLSLQIPLWGAAASALLPFANAIGRLNDSSLGNLRLSVQAFRRFAIAPRTALTVGGGIDSYAPTATPFAPQDPIAVLLAGPTAGESALFSPDLTIAFRPRAHVAGQLWIFSVQVMAAASVHFEGSQARVAIEWSAALSGFVTDWMALVVEAAGVAWVLEQPDWMLPRTVTLGGGLRFQLPWGWRPGIWVRGPVTDRLTEQGYGTFVGVEVLWQHERSWFLF
jgi:hypothetical protein